MTDLIPAGSYSTADPALAYEVEACTNYPKVKAELERVRQALRMAANRMEDCHEDLEVARKADFPPEDFSRIYDWHHNTLRHCALEARAILNGEQP